MAEPNFERVESLSTANVKRYIEYGQLVPKQHVANGKVGRYYRIFRDVADKDDKVLDGFVYCSICGEVLRKNAAGGTQPLNRHADACEKGKYFQVYHMSYDLCIRDIITDFVLLVLIFIYFF